MSAPIRRTTDVIAELLPLEGRRVLEAGCGEGVLVAWMRRRGAEAFGLETSVPVLRRARERLGSSGLVAARGEALPFAACSVEGVLWHNAFHHLAPAAMVEALTEASRVLVPEGRLLVLEPLPEDEYFELVRPLEDETAIRALAREVLERAVDLGFARVARSSYVQLVLRRSLDELFTALLAADPARAARLLEARSEIASAFARLGQPTAEGRVFRQPMLALAFARREEGPRIAIARARSERDAVFALRRRVFIEEQGVPPDEELDAFDACAEHLLARVGDEVVGTLRWRPIDDAGTVKLERVAVRHDHRGRGVARALLRFALARIDGRGLGPVVLHAQAHALDVYRGHGFEPRGEEFREAGIPHRRMERPLHPLAAAVRALA
ncbi:MAG: GNAT family N-acetyltransferase [Geminicoccaceae bacterium]|nr:GNAT family N-acetyltransferase [Geminicoccaceae bacterium]